MRQRSQKDTVKNRTFLTQCLDEKYSIVSVIINESNLWKRDIKGEVRNECSTEINQGT